jgi:hypothetical protein
MRHVLERCLMIVALVVAFSFQQTGLTRLGEASCDDEHDQCAEIEEPTDCPPSCADCTCCPGPARVLLSAAAPQVLPATVTAIDDTVVDAPHGRDARLRLERPPRA